MVLDNALNFRAIITTIIYGSPTFPLMDLLDQQKLVEDAKLGSDGFGKLYDYYFPKIYGFVLSKVHNTHEAEDITSEIFMKVVEHIHSFEWRGIPFTGWLFRIARNTLNNYYVHHAKTATKDIDEVYNLSDDEEKVSPHKEAVRNELAEKVHAVMNSLNEKELTVVQLKFFSQLNNREIMHATGLSESNVAIILFRTLRKIKPDLTYFA